MGYNLITVFWVYYFGVSFYCFQMSLWTHVLSFGVHAKFVAYFAASDVKWPNWNKRNGTERKKQRKWSKAVENEGQDPATASATPPRPDAHAKGQWRCLYKINEQTFPAAKSNYQEAPQEKGTERKRILCRVHATAACSRISSTFVSSVERKGNVKTFRTTTRMYVS